MRFLDFWKICAPVRTIAWNGVTFRSRRYVRFLSLWLFPHIRSRLSSRKNLVCWLLLWTGCPFQIRHWSLLVSLLSLHVPLISLPLLQTYRLHHQSEKQSPSLLCPSVSVYVVKLNASIAGRHWQICCNVALNGRDFPLLYLIRSVSLRFVLIKYHFFNTGFTLPSINHFPLPACLAACLPRNHPPSHFPLVSRNVICQVHIKSFLICYHYITHILFCIIFTLSYSFVS